LFGGKTWLRQDFARPAWYNDFLSKIIGAGFKFISALDRAAFEQE
jgi:uncharacterized protein YcsI (UPF0317 family)